MPLKSYRSWGACGDCGFQGLMEFVSRKDEDYEDENALGVMMDTGCPACGQQDAVLVVMEEYREMVFLARKQET